MDISYLSTSGAMSRPMMDDDGTNSSAAGSQKDKGRGSYKCGRVSLLLGFVSFKLCVLLSDDFFSHTVWRP